MTAERPTYFRDKTLNRYSLYVALHQANKKTEWFEEGFIRIRISLSPLIYGHIGLLD